MQPWKYYLFFGLLLLITDIAGCWSFLIPEGDHGMRTLDPYYNHGLKPNASGKVNFGNLSPVYYTNNLGLRDGSIRTVSLNPEKRRILFLGDSFAEGIGITWDSTFTGYLAKRDTAIEFLNAGVASYDVKADFLKLKYLVAYQHLKVNDVFCLVDFSDVPDALLYDDFVPKVKRSGVNEKLYNILDYLVRHSVLANLLFKLNLYFFLQRNNLTPYEEMVYLIKSSNNFNKETNGLYHDLRFNWAYLDFTPTIDGHNLAPLIPVRDRLINLFKQDLDTLAAYCTAEKIKLHYVVYAQGFQLTQDKRCMAGDKTYFLNVVESAAQKRHVDFINLYPCFVSGNRELDNVTQLTEFIHGNNHWNEVGHKRIADSLYNHMNMVINSTQP